MKDIIIIGASGHASVVLDCIEKENKYRVIGFVDSFKAKRQTFFGLPILGTEEDLPKIMSENEIFGGIIAIGDNWSRKVIADKIKSIYPNFNYINAIHPNTTIGKSVTLGKGTVLMPGVIINSSSVVGEHCILNTNSCLEHDSSMGNFSSISPKVCTGGNIHIGNLSAICLGATIIEGITIGNSVVIGAGSLVLNDISDNVVVYGAPAKIIRKRAKSDTYLGRNTFLMA